MGSKLLSIVIPIYNSEKYIENLLKIFMKQNLDNVEIILVDDGSKDNSLKICEEYGKKNNSFVVIHQENCGASAARNTGIAASIGEFISFVDSDDSISENYIEDICRTCLEKKADLYQFDAYLKQQDEITKREFDNEEGFIQLEKYYQAVLAQAVNEPWDKVYRNELLKKYNIMFDTQMTIGEDVSLTMEFLKHCQTVYVSHLANYYYERNEEGICASAKLKHLADADVLYAKMKLFQNEMNVDDETKMATDESMLKGIFRTVAWIIQNGEKKNNIVKKIETLKNVQPIFSLHFTSKSVELRRIILKLKMYHIASMIVGAKNRK